jgi:hypothetical protein
MSVTDRGRAFDLLVATDPELVGTENAIEEIIAVFAAVRLDERIAIGAWLRALYQTRRGDPTELAMRIEAGEHGS